MRLPDSSSLLEWRVVCYKYGVRIDDCYDRSGLGLQWFEHRSLLSQRDEYARGGRHQLYAGAARDDIVGRRGLQQCFQW